MRHTKKIIFAISLLVLMAAMPAFYYGWLGPHRVLAKAAFEQLPNWQSAHHGPALQAFQKSCEDILRQDPQKSFGDFAQSGKIVDWQAICHAAMRTTRFDQTSAREFFEKWFRPYQVQNNFHPQGMFTGYYLPLIHGSLQRDEQYHVPIYGMPKDLVKLDLGAFDPKLRGETVVARLVNRTLQPYPDRGAINSGVIENSAPVLVWADDPVDVFFAHIQGSALVQLPNKEMYLLSYAGTNGRPYTAIGKVLIDKKELTKDNVSMQSIRTWLSQHEEEMEGILDHDASYVFFTLSPLSDPVGASKVALTPERSLAVDQRYIPLGAPVWLETAIPKQNAAQNQPFHQLLIAQDSGGAIRGVVRGDVFWGAGEKAAYIAGHMQSPGQYWILLPKQMG